jgi:hypothetical protein
MNSVEWYREQSVVGSVVSHLKQNEWAIESVADTESRARGANIRAQKDGLTLIVEPLDVYAHGANKGKEKPTKPGVQACHWYSHVLLDAMLRQS